MLGGVPFHVVPNTGTGELPLEAVEAAIRSTPFQPTLPMQCAACLTHSRRLMELLLAPCTLLTAVQAQQSYEHMSGAQARRPARSSHTLCVH